MTIASHAEESRTLTVVRRWLLATLLVGIVGMEGELLLIGHFEDWLQLAPVVLLALGATVVAWHAAAPGAAAVGAVRSVMALFVVSGALGVVLHVRGNVEFELDMYPSRAGLELVEKTLTGATPVLAPGSMATREQILLIPNARNRMVREFQEYRPYKAIDQFRREIGTYVSKEEVARLERYVVIN